MKQYIVILFLCVVSLGSYSAQSFVGKLNPNPVQHQGFLDAGDSLKIIAVLVEFQEDKDDATFGDGKFGSIYSKDYGTYILDPLPHNKEYFEDHLTFAQNYFNKVSNEKFNISFDVLGDILTVSKTMRNYTPPINDQSELSPLGDFTEEVWSLADAHYSSINFSDYDLFVIFHAGVGKDVSLPGSIGNERDLPSVYLNEKTLKNIYGSDFEGYPVNGGTFNITNSAILPETESRELSGFSGTTLIELTINGLIAATIGSHLGLPDLYNTETGLSAIGRFGLMDGQSIFTYQGIFPPEMSAWEKMFLGWVTPIEIPVENSSITITAKYTSPFGDASLIKIPINSTEYYLIENRKRDAKKDGSKVTYKSNGNIFSKTFDRDYANYIYYNVDTLQGVILDVDEYDWALPGGDRNSKIENFEDVGLIIWHIDERVISEKYESNTINNDKFNRGVSIVEADGIQDIGEQFQTVFGDVVVGEGTKEDTWYSSNPAELYTNELGPATKPNTTTNSGASSLITMLNFSEVGNEMTFDLKFGSDEIDLIGNIELPFEDKINWLTKVNINDSTKILATTNDNVYVMNTNGNIINTIAFSSKFKPAVLSLNNSTVLFLVSATSISVVQYTESSLKMESLEIPISSFSTPPVIASIINNDVDILVGTSSGEIYRYGASFGANISFSHLMTLKAFDQPVKQIASEETIYIDAYNISAIGKNYYFGSVWPREPQSTNTVFQVDGDASQLIMTDSENGFTSAIQTSSGIYIVKNNESIETIYNYSDSNNSSLALSDIKNDGGNYIIQNSGEYLSAMNLAGSSANNFPYQDEFHSTFYSSPLSVDLNDDEAGEIITFTEDGKVIAVDGKTGEMIDGFPLSSGGKVATVPVIFSENGKTGLCLITEENQFISWYISKSDGKKFWTEEYGNSMNTSFVPSASSSELVTEFFPQSEAYNWPNPVYEGSTNIRYYVSEDSDAEVTIFDLAGDLVAKLSGKGLGGFDNEIVWDVSDIQSGVYFAHLKVTSNSGKTDTKIIKIAVIK
ncbi:MAG: T9SS type A sorting domain-containing protein [Bacteroidota bacterium]